MLREFAVWINIRYNSADPEDLYSFPAFLTLPRFPVAGDTLSILAEELPMASDPQRWILSVIKVEFSQNEATIVVLPSKDSELWTRTACEKFEQTIKGFSAEYGGRLIRFGYSIHDISGQYSR